MELFKLLLNDQISLLSLFTVAFCVGMAGVMGAFTLYKLVMATPPEEQDDDTEQSPRL